jgi:hypothetical protein
MRCHFFLDILKVGRSSTYEDDDSDLPDYQCIDVNYRLPRLGFLEKYSILFFAHLGGSRHTQKNSYPQSDLISSKSLVLKCDII